MIISNLLITFIFFLGSWYKVQTYSMLPIFNILLYNIIIIIIILLKPFTKVISEHYPHLRGHLKVQ